MSKGPRTKVRISLSVPFDVDEMVDTVVAKRLAETRSEAASKLIREGWDSFRNARKGTIKRRWVRREDEEEQRRRRQEES